jgi:hypothetical protein
MSTHLTTQELDGNRIESTGSRLVSAALWSRVSNWLDWLNEVS